MKTKIFSIMICILLLTSCNSVAHAEDGVEYNNMVNKMMASILLNPQLVVYNMALGKQMVMIRVVSCALCGIIAGLLIFIFYTSKDKKFFDFSKFDEEVVNRDTDKKIFVRYIKNFIRNVKATGLYFLFGILLSAIFQRYVSEETMTLIFGGYDNISYASYASYN